MQRVGKALLVASLALGGAGCYDLSILRSGVSDGSFALDGAIAGGSDAAIDLGSRGVSLAQPARGATMDGTSVSVSFGQDNEAGNAIVVYAYSRAPVQFAVSDSRSNTYSPLPIKVQVSAAGQGQLWYAFGTAAGPNTVSLQAPTSTILGLAVFEYRGLDENQPVVHSEFAAANSSSRGTTPDLDVAAGGLVISGFCDTHSGVSLDPKPGWTPEWADHEFRALAQDQIVKVGGAVTPEVSVAPPSSTWVGVAAAFRAR